MKALGKLYFSALGNLYFFKISCSKITYRKLVPNLLHNTKVQIQMIEKVNLWLGYTMPGVNFAFNHFLFKNSPPPLHLAWWCWWTFIRTYFVCNWCWKGYHVTCHIRWSDLVLQLKSQNQQFIKTFQKHYQHRIMDL